MKKILFTLITFSSIAAFSQDATVQSLKTDAGKTITKDPADTTSKVWKTGGLVSVNLSQGSLKNWAAGGDKFSLSLAGYFNVHAYYKKEKHTWDNNLDINLGYVNTTSLGTRKNDDRFDLLSKYGYALSPKLSASALFDFRSQFFDGFTYPDVNTKIFSSTGLAPAYVLLSPGLDWHPLSNFSVFVSPVTSRWVIVINKVLSNQGAYGVDTGKTTNYEIGAFASINYSTNLNSNVTYKGRLDLFSNYKHNPQNVDVYMTNLFAAKLSKVLSATWSVDLIYDDDVRLFGPSGTAPGLQIKSLIGAGLLVKF